MEGIVGWCITSNPVHSLMTPCVQFINNYLKLLHAQHVQCYCTRYVTDTNLMYIKRHSYEILKSWDKIWKSLHRLVICQAVWNQFWRNARLKLEWIKNTCLVASRRCDHMFGRSSEQWTTNLEYHCLSKIVRWYDQLGIYVCAHLYMDTAMQERRISIA